LHASVAIIGGGYAGMAAAVTLAAAGVPVTVFEAAQDLGGRARRVDWNGTTLDNGLHILVGAYRETLRLIRLVRNDADRVILRMPLDWRIHPGFALRTPALPAPLHLIAGLLLMRGAGAAERYSALRFMRAMRTSTYRLPEDTTVERLLVRHRQGPAITRHLWHPLCVAALNTPPQTASAQIFLNVLRDSLDAPAGASDLLLARCDLSALFPEPAAEYVCRRGGGIRSRHTVTAITRDADGYTVHARGSEFRFTLVVCALPPYRVPQAIAGLPQLDETRAAIAGLRYQPIYSVYLQYPGRVRLPTPMLGLDGAITHWAFDREAICAQRGLIGCVISAEGPHQYMPQDALARRVHQELDRHFGPLPAPLWQRVIAEKRATIACTPGITRPAQRTALPGFFLAGDYTEGEYPATLEAAVRSGVASARALLDTAPG
jgi:hydroxysqualene dehydroxylase